MSFGSKTRNTNIQIHILKDCSRLSFQNNKYELLNSFVLWLDLMFQISQIKMQTNVKAKLATREKKPKCTFLNEIPAHAKELVFAQKYEGVKAAEMPNCRAFRPEKNVPGKW